mgnify:CR=1 FL=1
MDDQRQCKRCGQEKSSSQFVINRSAASGGNICRDCRRKRDAERRAANPEQFRAAINKWTSANRERARFISRRADIKLRHEILSAYGGKCACCGETQILFLTIDHVNDDGKQQRLHGDHGCSYRLYRKLIREGFPAYCQVLCFNCNHGRFINGGVCPHKTT